VIYSGLDWSGSPGEEQGPWLAFAIVHVDAADLPKIEQMLSEARVRLSPERDLVFKHSRLKSSAEAHRRFYEAVNGVDWSAHVHLLDKTAWNRQHGKGARGIDCIRDGITRLVAHCPDAVVANQVLFIDLPRAEEKLVQDYRMSIRKALKAIRRTGFRNVRPCPDHRQHGDIVQMADMIAGELREHEGLAGPFLPGLGSRIQLV
jgi:hypothetical protein